MKTRKLKLPVLNALGALAIGILSSTTASAADHGDAPTLAHDQAADIADIYAFLDPNDNDKIILIGTVRGFIVPGEGVNFGIFDPVMRYRFEIERSGDAIADKFIDVTFTPRVADSGPAGREILQVPRAQTATLTISRLRGFSGGTFPNLPVLAASLAAGQNTPIATDVGTTGIRFFAGIVDDPFFFDIPAFARFIASIRNGAPDASVLERGRDSFSGYNIMAIALSIPKAMIPQGSDDVGLGFRYLTQRRTIETPSKNGTILSSGPFRTVDSMGNPAVNVALIPFNNKNAFNTKPLGAFIPRIVGTLEALGTNTSNIGVLASIAVNNGDYVRLRLDQPNLPADRVGGGAPRQGSFFPNGRRLRDDVVDALLSLVANQSPAEVVAGNYALGDNVDASISQFPQQAVFPFLAPAHQPLASANPANPSGTDDGTQN